VSPYAVWVVQCTYYFSAMHDQNILDMVERHFEIFMDEFSVFGSSFGECLHHLTLVLVRCKEKNLVLNWEK
jgi:hypothetical protein